MSEMSLQDIVNAVGAGLSTAARSPSILNYIPHKKQDKFHKSANSGRLYIGANRSGKTVAGVVEDVWWLTNRHPYQVTPEPPVYGRLITVDFKNGVEKIILPQLKQWLPPSELKDGSWERSYNKNLNILTLRNGSKLELMSHEQPLEKFSGTSRHFLHMDEECPKNIFIESKLRLLDVDGHWWLTMTPVEGMTWVFEDIFDANDPLITVITVDINDNPYLNEAARDAVVSGLDEEDRKIRARGEFVAIGGLVLREFSYDRHVMSPVQPMSPWRIFVSIDHGYNNPTAVLWHGISPNDMVVTFKEHYRAEWTVEQHARRIHAINEELKMRPDMYIADPAIQQRSAINGHSIRIEYGMNNIFTSLGKNNVLAGIDKMNRYLQNDKWFITQDCPHLLKEIRKYRWKRYESSKQIDKNNKREEPQKKDDHAIDSCRYMFSFMPDLHVQTSEVETQKNRHKKEIAELMQPGTTFDPTRARVYPWQYDPEFSRKREPSVGFGE